MAQKGLDRRNFLKLLGAGTCGAAVHHLFRPMNSMMAFAAPSAAAVGSSPVMVLVNLSGGCSYNIAPPYLGAYRDKNPTISYGPDDSLVLNSTQGLHPSLTAFQSAYDEGHLALVNMVGYPNPNRSHAESTDIWFRGVRQGGGGTGGWAARLTCQMSGLFSGVSLGGSNLLIQGDCNPPRAFGDLDNFGEDRFKWSNDKTDWLRITRDTVMYESDGIGNDNYLYVNEAMDNVARSVETVKRETEQDLPSISTSFPNSSFGRSCRDAARLIQARSLQTRFIFLERGGFDTHSGERSRLASNLADVNQGLGALMETAKALGRYNDLIIVTMSEFSRTHENGSNGTDHGHAGPLFVMGGGVRGGIKSPAPSAAEVNAYGYFHDYHVDFRQVFQEIVSTMGYDDAAVFPERISFSPLGLF